MKKIATALFSVCFIISILNAKQKTSPATQQNAAQVSLL